MRSSDKSVKLTLGVVRVLAAVFIVLVFTAPFLFKLYFDWSGLSKTQFIAFTVPFYACCPPAAITLLSLNKLLSNVKKGSVFVLENVRLLKRLSVVCLTAGILCIPVCFFLAEMFVFPAEAGFMSLILHVVKNVIEKGTEIKDENDLTI